MKKILSAILICCLLLGAAFALSSCGAKGDIENGTYKGENETITIKGTKMTMTSMGDEENGMEIVCTYDVNDEKNHISVTVEEINPIGTSAEWAEIAEEMRQEFEEEGKVRNDSDFEFTDNGFILFGYEYIKQ